MCRQGIWKNSLHSAQNDFLETNKQMNPSKRKGQQHANMQCISWTGYNLWFYGL